MGDGEPGEIIRSEEIRSPVGGMRLWTVLYRSTGLDGEPIAVSGVIVAPEDVDDGPHRFMSWAHPTTGLVDRLAPSRGGASTLDVDIVFRWAEDGFIVVATDYDGLGTPGPHPYLVGESEGRSVLDAARAARGLIGPHEGDAVVLAGHSQGGHAALFAAELAPTYAADVPVAGTVAIAPAGDIAALVSAGTAETANGEYRLLALMVIGAWHAALGLATDAILTPVGMAQADALVNEDRGAAFSVDGSLFLDDPASLPQWPAALEANTPGLPDAPESVAPILILQGTADTIITVESSQLVADRYCEHGAPVELRIFDGDDHITVRNDRLAEIDEWISQRLAGSPFEGC